MADSEDTAAKANDAAHAAAGTVTQAARSARSSARRTGSRARCRQPERIGALQLAVDPIAGHREGRDVTDTVVELDLQAARVRLLLHQVVPVFGRVVAPQ